MRQLKQKEMKQSDEKRIEAKARRLQRLWRTLGLPSPAPARRDLAGKIREHGYATVKFAVEWAGKELRDRATADC